MVPYKTIAPDFRNLYDVQDHPVVHQKNGEPIVGDKNSPYRVAFHPLLIHDPNANEFHEYK